MQIQNKTDILESIKIIERHVSSIKVFAEMEEESVFVNSSDTSIQLAIKQLERIRKFCTLKKQFENKKTRIMREVLSGAS